MKASQFSDAQKAFILKQGADGVTVADICRKAGISQATYFNWKKKYDGLLPTVTLPPTFIQRDVDSGGWFGRQGLGERRGLARS